ncbi:MAG: biotin/lipoyl-binding protein [Negativicutes bacterium]|nr:biotin/lipoyl-binding protein [Negativicutes bacterium]
MRKFVVKVNGVEYQVEVREEGVAVAGGAATAAQAPTVRVIEDTPRPAAQIAATDRAETPVVKAVAAGAGETAISAPMPGKIIQVKVKPGDPVEKDQVVIILEAMKMQNEIRSSVAGTIKAVNVATGQSVKPGEAMIIVG